MKYSHLSNTYRSLCNYTESLEMGDIEDSKIIKNISKINIIGKNPLFYYELLELFQTVHLSIDMHFPINVFFIGEGNSNISAFQCIQKTRNFIIRDKYFSFSSESLECFLRETNKQDSINRIDEYENKQNSIELENYTFKNLKRCIMYQQSSMELIISDAILPMTYNNEYIQDYEYQTTRIAMLQICFALCTQKKNGILILKIGDCFSPLTLDLICILSSFYNKTYFTKPVVSDSSSSSRFIICKGFLHENIFDFYPFIFEMFNKTISSFDSVSSPYLYRFIHCNIPKLFVMKIEEMNSIFGQPQLEQLQHIHSILTHKYKHDKINHFTKANIQKCIQWCIKHKVPFRNV